jgi:hypothetical protein
MNREEPAMPCQMLKHTRQRKNWKAAENVEEQRHLQPEWVKPWRANALRIFSNAALPECVTHPCVPEFCSALAL